MYSRFFCMSSQNMTTDEDEANEFYLGIIRIPLDVTRKTGSNVL